MKAQGVSAMSLDPTITDPAHYSTIFENERVRILQYDDQPGDRTHVHRHPDSVMVTLSSFRRRVAAGDRSVEVELRAGEARWVGAQEHIGENIGDSESHSIFIELKEPGPATTPVGGAPLGPSS